MILSESPGVRSSTGAGTSLPRYPFALGLVEQLRSNIVQSTRCSGLAHLRIGCFSVFIVRRSSGDIHSQNSQIAIPCFPEQSTPGPRIFYLPPSTLPLLHRSDKSQNPTDVRFRALRI